MGVSAYQQTVTQQATFTKINSGYANTTAGPTTNSFSFPATSGSFYLNQQAITSGSTLTVDLVSGGLKDLVGVQITPLTNVFGCWFGASSGGVQVETSQSGALKDPTMGLSGGGFLLNPGGVWSIGNGLSGYGITLPGAAQGNLVFRAVSGGALVSMGVYGL